MLQPTMVIEEVTDPVELERIRLQDERHRRNSEWLASHWQDLLPQARGRFVAVAGQQARITETAEDAWAWVRSTHPDDDGAVVQYVSTHTLPRIYDCRR